MEDQSFTATLKGVALFCLVETGVIKRNTDGSVETEAFERFWSKFERNVSIALGNELGKIWQERDQCTNDGRNKGDGRLYNHIGSALFFLAGFLFACLLK